MGVHDTQEVRRSNENYGVEGGCRGAVEDNVVAAANRQWGRVHLSSVQVLHGADGGGAPEHTSSLLRKQWHGGEVQPYCPGQNQNDHVSCSTPSLHVGGDFASYEHVAKHVASLSLINYCTLL